MMYTSDVTTMAMGGGYDQSHVEVLILRIVY